MRAARRLERLEERQRERDLLAEADRLAERYGVAPDVALHQIRELAALIERVGLDEALRLEARKMGVPEDEFRAEYERAAAELGDRAG